MMELQKNNTITRVGNVAPRLFEERMLVITSRDSILHRFNEVGILINEHIVKKLDELGILDIGISQHAADEKLHDRLTTMPGSFRLALSAIRLCVKADIKVMIKHSVSNANFGQYAELKHLAESEGQLVLVPAAPVPQVHFV
jgi:MoaA/NifB/PqqE/SkfB family radical SAM enzyme